MVNAVRQAPGYGGYQNMNGYPQQMQYPQNPSPQIYTVSHLPRNLKYEFYAHIPVGSVF